MRSAAGSLKVAYLPSYLCCIFFLLTFASPNKRSTP